MPYVTCSWVKPLQSTQDCTCPDISLTVFVQSKNKIVTRRGAGRSSVGTVIYSAVRGSLGIQNQVHDTSILGTEPDRAVIVGDNRPYVHVREMSESTGSLIVIIQVTPIGPNPEIPTVIFIDIRHPEI